MLPDLSAFEYGAATAEIRDLVEKLRIVPWFNHIPEHDRDDRIRDAMHLHFARLRSLEPNARPREIRYRVRRADWAWLERSCPCLHNGPEQQPWQSIFGTLVAEAERAAAADRSRRAMIRPPVWPRLG